MSVTRWITQDRSRCRIELWRSFPINAGGVYFRGESDGARKDLKEFQHDYPAAWAALDATRDASGMAGPIEVVVSIEPKGDKE